MTYLPAGFDFKRRAEREMKAEGFEPEFPEAALKELAELPNPAPLGKDLRSLLWSSIDNTGSKDLDQVEWVERLSDGSIRVLVGIADVDEMVRQGSAIDTHASHNATSVYTGGPVFAMLPERLSTDLSSLGEEVDRPALIIEYVVSISGEVGQYSVSRATIRNKARLTYDNVRRFLAGQSADLSAASLTPELQEQIRLQHEASLRLIEFRQQNGALSFGGVQHVPIVVNNHVKAIETVEQNGARDIIESFMVAANVCVARFLRERGFMAIRRVVRQPKRWDRIRAIAGSVGTQLPIEPDSRALCCFLMQRKKADPMHFPEVSLAVLKSLGPGEYLVEHPGFEREGHFGLAVHDYSHSTAPNRRYADLTMQRLIKAALNGSAAPYSEIELSELAARCTERESAARHVERVMKKVAAALMLSNRVGETFDAIVTGVAEKGTFVRLLGVPAEGRLMRGARGLDVGDKLCARLVKVDVERGFIDFETAS